MASINAVISFVASQDEDSLRYKRRRKRGEEGEEGEEEKVRDGVNDEEPPTLV